ncbi:MAG: diguanylate cyclase [Dehalococcoidia bacterium]|nr:MAG: diguanylate cyclase [Dehalococcoidia bacterium]
MLDTEQHYRVSRGGVVAVEYIINTDFERPDPALLERCRQTHVTVTGTRAGPRQIMDPAIKPLSADWMVCGPAFTVRPEWTDDLLMGEVAALYAKPGDIIVVDAGGRSDVAAWGAGMTRGVQEAQAGGVVVDGFAANGPLLLRYGLPVFARGTIAGASNKNDGPGWINVPVICGGVIVYPGDIIYGDLDGVCVIPREHAAAIIDASAGYSTRATAGTPSARSRPYHVSRGSEEKLRAIPNLVIR